MFGRSGVLFGGGMKLFGFKNIILGFDDYAAGRGG